MANEVAQSDAKTLDEEFLKYQRENPVLGKIAGGLAVAGVATQVAVDTVKEDGESLLKSTKVAVNSIALSDHPLETAEKYATALSEGALNAIKNAPEAILDAAKNVSSQLDKANKAQGLDAATKYGVLGAGILETVGPSHGKGKAVAEIAEAAVRRVEGELVDKAGTEVAQHAASASGNGLSTVVERAKHVAGDVKAAIMHPSETMLRKAGLIDVDTVLMGIAHKPLSAMQSMDIKHHGAGEQMIAALEAQKLERANALLKFAAENPAAAEQLKKANHTQLESLVMSSEADGFLGVKPLPQMLQRPLTATEQKINEAINNAEFMGGAADVAAAKQRQAARESMTSSEKALDWLKTHITYPGGHRPSIADADRLALDGEHSDSKVITRLFKSAVAGKTTVDKVLATAAMSGAYLYKDSRDNEAGANAFLKAANQPNGFNTEQFKREHRELLEKAVPIYKAMEQGIRAQYSQGGHVITHDDQKQIDMAMCNIASNIAGIIRKDGPSMEGKDVAKTLQNTSNAECAASV